MTNPNEPAQTPPETTATPAEKSGDPAKTAPASDAVSVSRTVINYIVIAAVFFGLGLLVGGMALNQDSEVDSDAIEQAVQNVLVETGLVQAPADMDRLMDDDPFLGPEDAPVVIVEFSAYACPYCGRHFNETLQPLLDNYGEYVRYVYRDFPSINPNVSLPAALAANCARDQGAFWEYHEMIFDNQSALTQGGEAYLNQLASDLNLDTDTFSTCLTEQTYIDEVNSDFNTGVAMGVTGTPSFYINGQPHSGARPYEYFEAIILRELDAAGIDY